MNLERPKVLYNEKTKKFVMWVHFENGKDYSDAAVVKVGEKYYMLTSFCTGWAPNQGKYAVADSIEGRWSMLSEIGDETTYHSQPAFILYKDGRILYYGDRWQGGGEKYFESSYVIYPLVEKENQLVMEYVDEIEI